MSSFSQASKYPVAARPKLDLILLEHLFFDSKEDQKLVELSSISDKHFYFAYNLKSVLIVALDRFFINHQLLIKQLV